MYIVHKSCDTYISDKDVHVNSTYIYNIHVNVHALTKQCYNTCAFYCTCAFYTYMPGTL